MFWLLLWIECIVGGLIANPNAIHTLHNARFTVLTEFVANFFNNYSQLIRLEYTTNNQFEDAATTVVNNRQTTTPTYSFA
jgi:hypothetical protein